MRLPFPERIPLPAAFVAATILAGLQQLQRTNLYFTLYSFLFIVIATIAFNAAGGFTRPSGSYVFFYAVLGLILGIVYKAYLGEPGESNLRSPILTMQVFTGGITGMLIAVLVSRKISRKKPLLGNILKQKDMRNAAIGCFAFGVFLKTMNVIIPHQDGSVLSAITQLDRFLEMSVILATLYTVRKSRGRSGFGLLVLVAIGISVCFGIIGFSKEGMFVPLFCWLVAAASLRLNMRISYMVAIGVVVYTMFHILVPFSQYGRTQVQEQATVADRVQLGYTLLSDVDALRAQYLAVDSDTEAEDEIAMAYYDTPQGFFDRLTMIGPDDALVNYTAQGRFTGLSVIPAYFANWIPHFLWPNKPNFGAGNFYAHLIGGILSEDDFTTGISFTPSGEAYQLAGWTGIFVVAPLIWIMLFTVFDSLTGDVRESPWGLLIIAMFSHVAPEGQLNGAIYIMWFGGVAVTFVALTTTYAMPVIGTLLAGPEQTGLVRLRRRFMPTAVAPTRSDPSQSSA